MKENESQNLAVETIEPPSPAQGSGLLPCRCGREVLIEPTWNIRDTSRQYWQIQCRNCGRQGAFAPSVEMAASLWNNDCAAPTIAEVEADEVSKALVDLRAVFPEEQFISIQVVDFLERPNSAVISFGFSAATAMEFKGITLAEAVTKVREWRKQQ